MAQSRLRQITAHLNYPSGLFHQRVVLITGGGQGIGAETARLFANEGAKVVISDIDAQKAEHVASEINVRHAPSSGEQGSGDTKDPVALAVPGDLLVDSYIEELVQKTATFGGGKIHVLVNNAGFTWDGVIHKMTNKQWDTMIAVHATVPFKLVRAASSYFRVQDGEPRCIVNISSTSGLHGNAGQANYALAKAGITGLTKTIAKEWGPQFGVRANTVAFGHILSRLTAPPREEGAVALTSEGQKVPLGIPRAQGGGGGGGKGQQRYTDIPLRRPGTATEAASAILAVASPYFSYVNGETISVTGGRNI